MFHEKKRKITILGSTGSIGTQALDIVRLHRDKLEIYALVAGSNSSLLIKQAKEFNPVAVVIADETKYDEVKSALSEFDIHVWTGSDSVEDVASSTEADMVLAAMVGFVGLAPTLAAIKAGRTIALANKETLVVAGDLIMKMSRKYHAPIIPVDSEHSAIFQCLVGETQNPISKIILTASGGPFVDYSMKQLKEVTPSQALNHPNWEMGPKVTVDSATLMNKGFEMIEAKWLFDVNPSEIEVLVHRQSIVHSLVEFKDSSVKAQLGVPSMKVPIAYALLYPYRLKTDVPSLDLVLNSGLTFERPREDFPNLPLAYRSIEDGGLAPCVLNAANEIAVHRFLNSDIKFVEIPLLIENMLDTYSSKVETLSLDLLFSIDKEVRIKAKKWQPNKMF